MKVKSNMFHTISILGGILVAIVGAAGEFLEKKEKDSANADALKRCDDLEKRLEVIETTATVKED